MCRGPEGRLLPFVKIVACRYVFTITNMHKDVSECASIYVTNRLGNPAPFACVRHTIAYKYWINAFHWGCIAYLDVYLLLLFLHLYHIRLYVDAQWVATQTIDIGTQDTIGDVIQRLGSAYNIPYYDWESIINSSGGALTLIDHRNAPVVLNRLTGERYELNFHGSTGVKHNVSRGTANQWNFGGGPGHSIRDNRAEDAGTSQTNVSLCVIL
ncbi:hypothetical protein F4818DRAFT_289260 [Hypoxylon cercidicola]|nr:hypothetical protein F4818DRAFT_289260 [Hypoxylon cercidicola]